MLGGGREGLEKAQGVPDTLPESFTEFGYQETSFVSFYRKSAGVLQDVYNFSTRCSEMRFWRMDGGRKMKEWVWR